MTCRALSGSSLHPHHAAARVQASLRQSLLPASRHTRPVPMPKRRVAADAADLRDSLAADWSRLMLALFTSSEATASAFNVTRQCADNWRSGEVCRPSGQHVALAALCWPEAFGRIIGRGAL